MKKYTPLAILAGLALTLTGCGSETPAPSPTVTATETVTETAEKTPQACLDYISATEKALTSASEVITAQQDALDVSGNVISNYGQPSNGDVAMIQDITERIKAENENLSDLVPKVQSAKAGCQAAA